MLDRLLAIGSVFDWITPVAAYIEDFFSDSVSDFGIPADAGWSTRDLKHILKNHGVRVWGVMLNLKGDTIMFTVSQAQAQWTYYLLEREKVPILYAPADVVSSASSQTPKKTSESLFDSFFDFLD